MSVTKVQSLPLDLFPAKLQAKSQQACWPSQRAGSPWAITSSSASAAPSASAPMLRGRVAPSPLRSPFVITKGPVSSVRAFHLTPSLAATPRTPTHGDEVVSPPYSPIFGLRPGSPSQYALLRPGQILLPSRGSDNDAARARNGGSRLNLFNAPGFRKAASEPILARSLAGSGEGLTSPQFPSSPKTPRTLRGVVRKASKVTIGYPNLPAPLPPRSASTPSRPASSSTSISPSGGQSTKASKRVSFADEHGFEPAASPEGRGERPLKEACLKRSRQMMASLYDLRRVGLDRESRDEAAVQDAAGSPTAVSPIPDDAAAPLAEASAASAGEGAAAAAGEGGGVAIGAYGGNANNPSQEQGSKQPLPKAEEIKDEPLFYATLGDTTDFEGMLRRTEKVLAEYHEPVHEYGGSRHATAVISGRTLAVVRRKAQLLHAGEGRLAAFLAAQARKEELLKELVANTEPNLDDLVRINKFLQAHIHKGGNPSEANKSDFGSFVSSFGLPEKHQIVIRLNDTASEAVDWWAQAALREAQAGSDTAAVSRLLDLAADILGNKDHPNIIACRDILGNILAENALKSALKIQEKDAMRVASSSKPQPESAKKSAEAINLEIKTAVAMGCQPKHESLKQAKAISVVLENAEKDRLAETVLMNAKEMVAKDEAAAAKVAGIPPVGPASDMADRIEQEAWAMIKERGVPEEHPTLKEAMSVGKSLRDKDGERKRLLAREKRLAGK